MAFNIIVFAKQVIDPETPASAFNVDEDARRVVPAQGIPPVVNGFDENAVEAALKIKESIDDAAVTVISTGTEFVMDVMKKPLSMGADNMVLVQDDACTDLDAFSTVRILTTMIGRLGDFDLIICGQQASDWDNAHVPLGIAETLGLPCLTEVRAIEIGDDTVTVNSSRSDGYEVFESSMPALITVNNEVGQPRYPTLRGIMQASRKTPEILSIEDVGLNSKDLTPVIALSDLFVPTSDKQCEIIEGEDDADSGRLLALRLREEKII